MESELDRRLVALCGSKTRAYTLAALANAYRPLTGYRVAKTGGVPIPKAHEELRRLERAGLVARRATGWVLLDSDIRAFLRKRVQVLGWDDWRKERKAREAGRRVLLNRIRQLPVRPPPKGWKPRKLQRFHRSSKKDEILRRLGLRPAGDAH
jgi:hypothetical protein